jgi:alkylation response protein AidB-like acyl-CoA dehydrogenase
VAERQSGPLLMRFGTEAQRERFLPQIARGELSFAIGMSEPDSGSDLASIRTRAVRRDGGYVVNGTKVWTSNAHRSQYAIALFRTAVVPDKKHEGLSQFLVDLTSPGITIRPIINLAGSHDFNEVVFQDAFVPEDMRVGAEGDGWKQVTTELAFERSGPERFLSVFPLLAAYARRERLADPAAAQEEIGRMAAHLAALRRMAIAVASRIDAGADPANEAALVKDLGNAFEREMAERLRLLPLAAGTGDDPAAAGVRALLDDTLRDAVSYTLRGGTPEVLRGMIARGLGLR